MALQKPRQIETQQSEALITLSPKLRLNVNDIIGQQLAAFGMPGFGKTNAAVLTCEQIGQYCVPMAIFDKEGDWLSMAGVLPRGMIATRDNCPTGRDILNRVDVLGQRAALARARTLPDCLRRSTHFFAGEAQRDTAQTNVYGSVRRVSGGRFHWSQTRIDAVFRESKNQRIE